MRRRIAITRLLLAQIIVLLGNACASDSGENQWGPFVGTVVDDSSSQPVPGAVCVAIWLQDEFRLADTHSVFRDVQFSVADAQGNFAIAKQDPPFFFPKIVNPVHLDCVAPGYKPHHSGAQVDPMLVRLRPLTREQEQYGVGRDANIGIIPFEKCVAIEHAINATRNELALLPMEFCGSGSIKRRNARDLQ